MHNQIAVLLLIVGLSASIFALMAGLMIGDHTADLNAQLAAAYKKKADAFEELNVALNRQIAAQDALLNAYREKYGN